MSKSVKHLVMLAMFTTMALTIFVVEAQIPIPVPIYGVKLGLANVITLIVLVILFALAVVWISKQGGWKGEGCGGNCASCHSRCENPDPGKKH